MFSKQISCPLQMKFHKEELKMKFKKALVVILALAMVVTLMPTAAFATTSNSVAQTYTVAANEKIPTVALNLKLTNLGGIAANEDAKFSVSLTNAEFQTFSAIGTQADDKDVLACAMNTHAKDAASVVLEATDKNGAALGTALADANVELVSSSETKATILVKNYAQQIDKDQYLNLYLNLKSKNDDGEVKVAVDGLDSKISSGTYTVATVNSNTTKAKVTGDVKTYGRTSFVGAEVEIQESAVNSITANQRLKLTLPKDFDWTTDTVFGGDLLNSANANKKLSDAVWTDDTNKKPEAASHYWIDGRNLYVYVPVNNQNASRQSLTIKPGVKVGKSANKGDITLSISTDKADSGNSVASESDLVIAKYGDEAVTVTTVEEKNLPEIVAGYQKDSNDKEFYVQVTLTEAVKESITLNKAIDFDMNDEVQVLDGAKIRYYVGTSGPTKKYKDATPIPDAYLDMEKGLKKDTSEFTIEVDKSFSGWKTDKGNVITFFIPVTVKADYTGDIKLNIKGAKAGVENKDLVLGKAVAPISVETKVTKVINGAQKQALADIIIKENVAGYLKDDKDKDTVALAFDTLGLVNGFAVDNAKVEVTEGNIEIDSKVDIKNVNKKVDAYDKDAEAAMKIKVKDSSTKASTIKISGVTASLSRLLPEGEYKLEVFGPALEDNTKYNDDDFNVPTVKVPYVNIATAADTQQAAVNSKFVIGDMKYTVNDVENTMDVAPFIDANNRTMVPIRFVANALGVSDQNITYNNASTTATISGSSNVVNIKTGSKVLVCSTGNINMDTTAVNSNGRLYVPVRFIANALGAEVSWDPATKTVAVFTSSK